MPFNSPDLNTFKNELENSITAIQQLKVDNHATIKIQALLNITVYVLATRFLEGSVKHIIFNCCIMRGDNPAQLTTLDSELKGFNNPDFSNIRDRILQHLAFDINNGLNAGRFLQRDISLLNEIVRNRHKNVHATYDSSAWYGQNIKDITNDFQKECVGLLNILTYLDSITWDGVNSCFCD